MSTNVIKAQNRKDMGKGASRRLRKSGKVPAIIYGGQSEPVNIELSHDKVWQASEHGWFYSTILDLDLEGKKEKVLLRDMQRHPFKQIIMHLDFQRVEANVVLTTAIPLQLVNQESSPAGKLSDVVITQELNEVVVSCLPKDLPEFLEVDLSKLEVGDVVMLSAVKLPKGVEIPSLQLGEEHDQAVVIARHGRVEAEPEVEESDEPEAKKDSKDEPKED